jgi:hypothetical protein
MIAPDLWYLGWFSAARVHTRDSICDTTDPERKAKLKGWIGFNLV